MFPRKLFAPNNLSIFGQHFSRSFIDGPSFIWKPSLTVFVTDSSQHLRQFNQVEEGELMHHVMRVGVTGTSRHNNIASVQEAAQLSSSARNHRADVIKQDFLKAKAGAVLDDIKDLIPFLEPMEREYPAIRVIFSFGGTLALPYRWLPLSAMIRALSKHEIAVEKPLVGQVMDHHDVKGALALMLKDATEHKEDNAPMAELIYQHYLMNQKELMRTDTQLVPGALDVMKAFHGKYSMALTTGLNKECFDFAIERIIEKEKSDIRLMMGAVVTGDMVKPGVGRVGMVGEAFRWMVLGEKLVKEEKGAWELPKSRL